MPLTEAVLSGAPHRRREAELPNSERQAMVATEAATEPKLTCLALTELGPGAVAQSNHQGRHVGGLLALRVTPYR